MISVGHYDLGSANRSIPISKSLDLLDTICESKVKDRTHAIRESRSSIICSISLQFMNINRYPSFIQNTKKEYPFYFHHSVFLSILERFINKGRLDEVLGERISPY